VLPAAAPLKPMPSSARANSGTSSGNVALWVWLGVGGAAGSLIATIAVVGVLFWRDAVVAVAPPSDGPATGTSRSPPAAQDPTRPATPVTLTAPFTWEAQADPPQQLLTWPAQPAIDIPIPRSRGQVVFSATPSPFMVLGMNVSGGESVTVWDLAKQQQAGALQEPVQGGDPIALSPDGQYLAVRVSDSQHHSKLHLLSFRTGKLVRELECDDAKVRLQSLHFSAPNRLVTQVLGPIRRGARCAISVWDVASGNRVCDIPVDATYPRDRVAISPGGRYLATMTADKLLAFDLSAGGLAGKLATKDLLGERLGALLGISFSPDGRQLGIVLGATNSRLVLLDFCTGQIADQIELAGRPPLSSAYRGRAVEWLGEKGWCLFGSTLVDRATRRAVWHLDLPTTERPLSRHTLPDGWIAATGPFVNRRLRFVPIPWDKIQASLAAQASNEAALLRPGMSVTIELTIEKLRFSDTEADTKKKLAGVLQERFQADGISVGDNQPLILKVSYSESAGETLPERRGIAGPPTGRTVHATNVKLKLTLAARNGGQVVWEQDVAVTPHVATAIDKDAVDAHMHDAILQQVLSRVSLLPIPYFVPQDKSLSHLPGATKPSGS
jgi:WD40 repeat protein